MTTLPVHPGADDVLDALDPEQREVAAHPLGPMCVLAGAGTGKTRAITHRIAYGVLSGAYQPQRVLAVTFTARAAGEMRTRLRDLGVGGVQARTFHAAALRQLHYFWPQAVGGAAPEVMPHKAGAVAEAGGRLRLRLDSPAVRDVAAEIEWSKVSMLTADSYAAAVARERREPPAGLDATAMARVIAAYEEVKTQRGVIDFEDVLLLMAGILGEHDQVARAVRGQYRHFVVDEYQDVNRLQQRLLELWLGERDDVCVVGDPAQTIYSFTGASPQHLLGFRSRHPQARVVELVRNYRSTPQVVGLANLVLRSPGGGRRSGSVELRAQRADGAAPELLVADDDPAEAEQVAERVRALVDAGHPAAEVAVLFRTNGQSELFESALAERGIPYLVRGGERFFSRKEVRDALVLMRGAARSDDGEVPLPDLVRDVLLGAGWTREAPTTGGAARERWESLAALAALADDLAAADPEARLPVFVRELDERAAAQHAPTVQGVTLASLHAAKGLEWDTVFLVGCSDGLLPITMAETPDEIEEERRLLYVGVTRARERLVLSYSRARTPGAKGTRRPSRFLDGTESVLGAAARSQPRRKRATAKERAALPSVCRVCGGGLATAKERTIGRCTVCPPTMDEQLFEELRGWRLETARELDVPAYVVFTDATLTAIAEREPAERSDLARIAGVGPAKLERFGEAVLEIVKNFSAATNG
ncbi:ATP-dependent DNA helicase UvrD2 [Phycicoccus sp.]|uniref:ATP-dependent DNA helicase UvrD2 n=1 Tax=Phycicoccus sp. TaxID=1902410 RepID=UPI002C90A8C3|nr:ATP-dependent DNA helicase UvrD2 [Phycicoccus sp.]HMM94188.1 ATP-dependent DNA helicase UvrD2 [Phycicoccus sp.]